jgi:uncharacterized membrane-anchored protein YhcB (DUF1043 family)
VGAIDNPNKWVTKQAQVYQRLTETLKTKRQTLQKQIKTAKRDCLESLQQQIGAIFQETINAIPSFAEDYWESNENQMKSGWEQTLKSIRFEERLKAAYQENGKIFNKEVQEAIEEVGNELKLMAQLEGGNFQFVEQDSNTFNRQALKIGGILLMAMAGLVLGPLGLGGIAVAAVGIAGSLMTWVSQRFKSKDQKRSEAVQNIKNSLTEQLSKHKQATLRDAEANFSKFCDSVAVNIDAYFAELIQGLEAIATQLEEAKNKLSGTANYLNRAYAKRIIDWSTEQQEPLTVQGIKQTIYKVERDFGRSMKIVKKSQVPRLKSLDDIKHILQEDISFSNLPSPKKD